MRESNASTSASKYFYSSPRPWRMNDNGKVVPLDKDGDGKYDLENINGTNFDMYESSVSLIPALKYARATADSWGKTRDIQVDILMLPTYLHMHWLMPFQRDFQN